MHEDQIIGIAHGEKIVCGVHGRLSSYFRASPISSHNMWCWVGCCCQAHHWKGGQGRVKKAYGNYRHPKTLNTLRAAEGFRVDGIKVRRSECKQHLPTAWEDQYAHAEKNWKRHRKTQWKQKRD